MAPSRVRDGRPSSLATTEVPALMSIRRALRRALRESGSVDMLVDQCEWLYSFFLSIGSALRGSSSASPRVEVWKLEVGSWKSEGLEE